MRSLTQWHQESSLECRNHAIDRCHLRLINRTHGSPTWTWPPRVGPSASACSWRLDILTAAVSSSAITRMSQLRARLQEMIAIVHISLGLVRQDAFGIRDRRETLPERVLVCYLMSGEYDYILGASRPAIWSDYERIRIATGFRPCPMSSRSICFRLARGDRPAQWACSGRANHLRAGQNGREPAIRRRMKSKTRGYIFVLLAITIFSIQDGISKHLGGAYPPVFVTMIRYWAWSLHCPSAAKTRGGIKRHGAHHKRPVLQVIRADCCSPPRWSWRISCFAVIGLAAARRRSSATPILIALRHPLLGERVAGGGRRSARG